MTRLAFLLLALVSKPDRGPKDQQGHINVERRGILYCSLPGDQQGPYPDLTIENNSAYPAQVIYRGQTFNAPDWSTTTYQ